MDYEERRQETTKDERVKATIPQKASKGGTESTRSDESLPQSTSVTIHPITTPLDDSRVNGTTDVATNYYDNDLGMEKVPEVEEGGEVIENATQTSLGNLKEVATTLNLSQAQTAAFVQIIEKIVDEELKRRRDEEMFKSKVTETSEKSKSIAAKFHELYNESEKVESMDGYYEDEITPHEKLTANTRLRFDEQHIIDDYQSGQDEISDARLLESDSREEVRWKAGYMAREQSEYDRLISGTTDATLESDHLDTKSLQDSRRELLRTTVRSTSTAKSPTVSTVHDENVEEPYIQSRTTMIYGKGLNHEIPLNDDATSSSLAHLSNHRGDECSRSID
ncbi:unnamed protein product [Litomosoides sigmodontis]|uniref:Uncharacterized protein n=1 Tax=Litomosoides sigmodontis TaxID=42156 RepID=A0A3P6SIN8_LITSI|nr:unnamed protein product [Litomosoides sigmodontis]